MRAHLIHEALVESDHRRLIFLLDPPPARCNFLFRFEAKWLLHPQYFDVVSSAWHMSVFGSLMCSFMQHLKASRSSSNWWHSSVFKGDILRMQSIQQQLKDLYSKPFDSQNAVIESSLLSALHDLQQRDKLH